jgi:hypothetical protein
VTEVRTFNLATGESGPTYVGLTPEDAVRAANAQSKGDFNTWEYDKYEVVQNGLTVRSGDFTAKKQDATTMVYLGADGKPHSIEELTRQAQLRLTETGQVWHMGTTILIVGRRWFQRSYGNTYHTAEVFVDGRLIGKTPKAYGYGEQYVQSGVELAQDQGYLPAGDLFPYWKRIGEELGIAFQSTVVDVERERDL